MNRRQEKTIIVGGKDISWVEKRWDIESPLVSIKKNADAVMVKVPSPPMVFALFGFRVGETRAGLQSTLKRQMPRCVLTQKKETFWQTGHGPALRKRTIWFVWKFLKGASKICTPYESEGETESRSHDFPAMSVMRPLQPSWREKNLLCPSSQKKAQWRNPNLKIFNLKTAEMIQKGKLENGNLTTLSTSWHRE